MKNKAIIFLTRFFGIIIIIFWAFIVFKFSSQNGAESSRVSGKVIQKVLYIKDKVSAIKDDYHQTRKINLHAHSNKEITKTRIHRWQRITRKLAHFTLYTTGGICIYLMLSAFITKQNSILLKIGITIFMGIGYAISDEFHQMFSAGRTPGWVDVKIDSLGIVTGMILAMIMVCIVNRLVDYIYEKVRLSRNQNVKLMRKKELK